MVLLLTFSRISNLSEAWRLGNHQLCHLLTSRTSQQLQQRPAMVKMVDSLVKLFSPDKNLNLPLHQADVLYFLSCSRVMLSCSTYNFPQIEQAVLTYLGISWSVSDSREEPDNHQSPPSTSYLSIRNKPYKPDSSRRPCWSLYRYQMRCCRDIFNKELIKPN